MDEFENMGQVLARIPPGMQVGDVARLIIDRAYDAFIAINTDGLITDWNRQAENMFGFSRQEVVGRRLSDTIIPPHLREAHERGLRRCLETGEGPVINRRIEITAQHRDGHEFPVELAVFPVEVGTDYSFCAFIHDITARKEAEKQLHDTTAELARSNADLEQFAYLAAHDLREPLATVSSYVSMLAETHKGKFDANTDENLGFIVDAVQRMQTLIDDLLTYSRVGTQAGEVSSTHCGQVLERVLKDLQGVIDKSGAQITHGELPTIAVDPQQVAQLFQNLVGNAIKFRGERQPRIHISAERRGHEWVFSVADNGIGIDMKFSDRIFGIFQRLNVPEADIGSGLGLAICKKIVERHGGRIWVESRLGEGSSFYFAMPAA
jgi:PAS domain S-box-containing protein